MIHGVKDDFLLFGTKKSNFKAQIKGGNSYRCYIFSNVIYVENLRCNMLSVSRLETNSFNVSFDDDIVRISKNSKILAEGERCGRLYKIKFIVIHDAANLIENI